MSTQKHYIVTIGFRAKEGKAADLERELRNRVPITRTEAGVLDYRLYRSRTDRNLFFVFSRYASEKLFDVHLYQPYSLSMLAEFESLLDGPPKVETYETVLG
ncbi:MAG TPA: putative quinol monooxygenase [Phycisphaerae bacterium]|nr:putative quinol monooxygenase [Phycisphaerae bacterium]